MPDATLAGLRLDADPAWQGERRVGDHVVPVVIWIDDPSVASADRLAWVERAVDGLEQLDEQARALLAVDVAGNHSETSVFLFCLSSLAGARLQEMFGRGRWEVDFAEYCRALRLVGVRLDVGKQQAVLDYGMDGCVWQERLRVTLPHDRGASCIARTWGQGAGTHPAHAPGACAYFLFDDDLDNDTLLRAVDSLRVPGLSVWEIIRDYVGAQFTTEMAIEGATDSLAIARMLRDTLGRSVVLSDSFFGYFQWLLLDPQRGEWLIDEDERNAHILVGRWPFRPDLWAGRPPGATGLPPLGWTPEPLDGGVPEAPNYTNLALPRDLPVAAIGEAVVAAGGTLVWTSQSDPGCLTFACVCSRAAPLAFARKLAVVLARDVVAGFLLRSGPSWVLLRSGGDDRLADLDDACVGSLRVGAAFEPAMLEDPPPRCPSREGAPGRGSAVGYVPPVYTTLLVPIEIARHAIDAAVASVKPVATLLWQSPATFGCSQLTFRSEADQLTVARSLAALLRCRVVVGLALREEPAGWVILEPGGREYVAERWMWDEEFAYLRPFDEGDYVRWMAAGQRLRQRR